MAQTLAELTSGTRQLALPIRIVSDWHLGHPGSRLTSIAMIEHLLDGVGTLVMAGDGREELVASWRGLADELWGQLEQGCRNRGVEFIALTGNHDPEVSLEGWLTLDEGRILVTHGDMIYETASPWSKELFAKREEVASFLNTQNCRGLMERWQCALEVGKMLRPCCRFSPSLFGYLAYLKLALWPPERLLAIGKVWAGFAREGNCFLNKFAPETETLVCGHFHRPGRFQVGAREVINTGSLMRLSKGLVVDYDGKSLKVRRLNLAKKTS